MDTYECLCPYACSMLFYIDVVIISILYKLCIHIYIYYIYIYYIYEPGPRTPTPPPLPPQWYPPPPLLTPPTPPKPSICMLFAHIHTHIHIYTPLSTPPTSHLYVICSTCEPRPRFRGRLCTSKVGRLCTSDGWSSVRVFVVCFCHCISVTWFFF